jgi:hypothetical protein
MMPRLTQCASLGAGRLRVGRHPTHRDALRTEWERGAVREREAQRVHGVE